MVWQVEFHLDDFLEEHRLVVVLRGVSRCVFGGMHTWNGMRPTSTV